ncbi:MAG: copper resistance protein CopC [Acetobacteraceae bacterium]|nr:copper resistance protein CopC [Acetobacteraceae bacterium]
MRVRRALLGAPLALVMALGDARAHALVVPSDPAAGTVLASPPARVIIRFNSRIDPVRSRLSMIPGEARQGAAALPLEIAAAADPTLIEAP